MVISLFPVENFPNEVFAVVFSLIFIVVLLMEVRILFRNKGGEDDKKSMFVVLIGIFIPLIVMITLSYFGVGRINFNLINYLGMIILIGGFYLRQSSIKALGKYFLPVVSKQKGQRIIQKGVFKQIRHPSYTGLLLELFGASLALANWISVLIVIVLFIPAISYRIKTEEEFLSRNFREYGNYQKRTWKLIPFVF